MCNAAALPRGDATPVRWPRYQQGQVPFWLQEDVKLAALARRSVHVRFTTTV